MARQAAGGVVADLRRLKDQWSKGRALAKEMGGNSKVPDGTYLARLTDGKVEGSSSGLRLNMFFVITEGDFEGEIVRKSDGLETDKSCMYAQSMFAKFGYDPDEFDPEQVPAILEELKKAKPVCKIQVKKNGEFNNVYVNEVLEDGEGGEEDEDSVELEVGTRVKYTFRGTEQVGEITEIVDDETVKVKKDSDGKIAKVKVENLELEDGGDEEDEEDEEETDEEDEEEVELAVGMQVEFKWKGVDETGVVTEIVDDEFAKVKKDSDSKVAKVKIESLTLADGDETDEEEAEDEEEEEEEETPPPAKRGPGRPRKDATPPPAAKAPAKSSPVTKTATKAAAAPVKATAPVRKSIKK